MACQEYVLVVLAVAGVEAGWTALRCVFRSGVLLLMFPEKKHGRRLVQC